MQSAVHPEWRPRIPVINTKEKDGVSNKKDSVSALNYFDHATHNFCIFHSTTNLKYILKHAPLIIFWDKRNKNKCEHETMVIILKPKQNRVSTKQHLGSLNVCLLAHPKLVRPIFESAVIVFPGPIDNGSWIACRIAPKGELLAHPHFHSSRAGLRFDLGFWKCTDIVWKVAGLITGSYPELVGSVGEFAVAVLAGPVDDGARVAGRVAPESHVLPDSTLQPRRTRLSLYLGLYARKLRCFVNKTVWDNRTSWLRSVLPGRKRLCGEWVAWRFQRYDLWWVFLQWTNLEVRRTRDLPPLKSVLINEDQKASLEKSYRRKWRYQSNLCDTLSLICGQMSAPKQSARGGHGNWEIAPGETAQITSLRVFVGWFLSTLKQFPNHAAWNFFFTAWRGTEQ